MLRSMLTERQQVYAELATLTIATDELSPEEIAEQLAQEKLT
jgi:shikimate kinase